jgi:hypothetical protein
VHLTGIAGRELSGDMVVVDVIPDKEGTEWMDQYAVQDASGRSAIYYSAELGATSYRAPGIGKLVKL